MKPIRPLNIVLLVPFRGDDGGRRDDLWKFTRHWLNQHHGNWPLFTSEGPDGAFNRGAAINDAAVKAGEWDVAVITDSDNICDPAALTLAATMAYMTDGCVFPFTAYIYADQVTSDGLIEHGSMFVAPDTTRYAGPPYVHTVRHQHCSGIQAISRKSFDAIGGIPELAGWGSEDYIAEILLRNFGGPLEWLPGSAIHLWHQKAPEDRNVAANRAIYQRVRQYRGSPAMLRRYLASIGHHVP